MNDDNVRAIYVDGHLVDATFSPDQTTDTLLQIKNILIAEYTTKLGTNYFSMQFDSTQKK